MTRACDLTRRVDPAVPLNTVSEYSAEGVRRSYGTMFRMVPSQTQERLLSQMRRGTLEYCVLAVLRDGERYGFDLVKSLSEVDGMVTSEGTIYPLLTRLRKDGLVASSWQESPQGPPRRYYRITAKGRRALDGFMTEWRRFRTSVDALLERGGGR